MEIKFEKTGEACGKITVSITEADYADKVTAKLKEIGKKHVIPGFRKGHIARLRRDSRLSCGLFRGWLWDGFRSRFRGQFRFCCRLCFRCCGYFKGCGFWVVREPLGDFCL